MVSLSVLLIQLLSWAENRVVSEPDSPLGWESGSETKDCGAGVYMFKLWRSAFIGTYYSDQ